MAVVAEIARVLTVREPAAANLLAEGHALTTVLPLTLSALRAGTISWQHAPVMVNETTNADPAGARAWEAHFLAPAAVEGAARKLQGAQARRHSEVM